MKIIGLDFGYSSSAALVEDGKVLAAIEEEKLSRCKDDLTFPFHAIKFIYNKYKISENDIDFFAISREIIPEFLYCYRVFNQYFKKKDFLSKMKGIFYDRLKILFPLSFNLSRFIMRDFYSHLKKIGIPHEKIILVNHHKAHAAGTYYTSGWKDALIITNNGKSDGLSGTCYMGKNSTIKCLDEIIDDNSIGQFYQSVTRFLGFLVNRHEGKITGLAAHGDYSRTFPKMNEIFKFDNGKLKNTFYDVDGFTDNPLVYFKKHIDRNDFIKLEQVELSYKPVMDFMVVFQMYLNYLNDNMKEFEDKDIAAGIQKLAEDALVSYINARMLSNPSQNVCLSGGVFANVKINQRIKEMASVKNIYIDPAMDDAGTSLGAALSVAADRGIEVYSLNNIYLGPEYSEEEIEQALKKYNLRYERLQDYEKLIGKFLNEGKIIGRFNGRLEWGPRALGNRSILVRPTDKKVTDILNKRLKRTEFMPFAPSILDADAESFLVGYSKEDAAAKYMTVTYDVTPERIGEIEAAVHVDGTARPQVVFEKDNPSFYRIIKAYKEHSGFGVIINTSFNIHEEPIVDTPEDAIKVFLAGAVDVLSMGSFIVMQDR